MKKRVISLVIVLLVVLGAVGGAVFMKQNYLLVRRYQPENIKNVWKWADMAFATYLNRHEEMLDLLDAAENGSAAEAMSAYRSYQDHLEWFRINRDREMRTALDTAYALLDAYNGVFEWSHTAFQSRNYEELISYTAYSAEKFDPYFIRLAELITDRGAYDAHAAQHIVLMRAAVQADMQVAMSLYQLVYREFFGYRDIRKNGETLSGIDGMSLEDQEDLICLSLGDLQDLYFARLNDLWKTENQLAACCDAQM